jgi:hypothetical protein
MGVTWGIRTTVTGETAGYNYLRASTVGSFVSWVNLSTVVDICSVKVVAGPRNQRESRRRIDGAICFCALAQFQYGGQFAMEFDLERTGGQRHKPNLLD